MPDVKVKGYSGTFFEYKDVDKVWLQTADSTEDDPVLVPYSYGEVVEGTQITPDFSAGDMSISVPDGYLVKEAVILKPADLVTEKIAAGEYIAGVGPGTYEGSRGATEPYIEYTRNDDGEITTAKMYGFTTIPTGCFAHMDSLESVDFTESPNITSIGDYAFFKCNALSSFDIPDGVTSIGAYAFYQCKGLTSVTLPDSLISIGDRAFQSCNALVSVTLPDSLISMGAYVFQSCNALVSVTLPDSLISIPDYAFNATGLTNITIPDSVTSIGTGVFNTCKNLTNITIPANVTSIGQFCFNNSGLTSAIFEDTTTWYLTKTNGATSGETLSSSDLANTSTAATYLKTTYYSYYWYKK